MFIQELIVYSSENDMCVEVTVTKCRYPGDISDNCISCPDETPYIYPPNGNCVSDCGVRYYPRDDIYQCRSCHSTCYTCWGYEYNNCLSCIDDLYLWEGGNECIPFCHEVGQVESKIYQNLCVEFEVKAELINYQEGVPIDINTFDFLVAEVTQISTKPYYTTWRFDPVKTRNANPGLTLNFVDGQVPFEPNDKDNLESLNVTLNHSFFELARKYVFVLDVISYNILDTTKRATRSFYFTLTTNSYPVDGGLEQILIQLMVD